MATTFIYNDIIICGNSITINGKKLPPCPYSKRYNSNITVTNSRVFMNGYEYRNGVWKKTLLALWYLWF